MITKTASTGEAYLTIKHINSKIIEILKNDGFSVYQDEDEEKWIISWGNESDI